MKQISFILVCIFISNAISSQERISNFISEGSNNDQYLRTYDNTNYLLTVDQNNLLSVYHLLDQSNKVFLHSQTFQGLYGQSRNLEFKDNYLIFGTANSVLDYDYVNNQTNTAELPEGFYFSSFTNLINTSNNRIPVSIKDINQAEFRGLIYELGGTVYEIDGSTFMLYGDIYFDKKYNQGTSTRTAFFHNFIANTTDTIGYNFTFGQYPAQVDSSIYYFNEVGELYSYDKLNRNSTPVANIKLEKIGFTNSLLVDDNDLILMSSTSDSCFIQHYDRLNLNLKNTFRFDLDGEYLFASKVKINNGVLTALLDYDLFILDLNTGEHFIRPTNYYWVSNFEIIDNRYILNPYNPDSYFNPPSSTHKFEIIDLSNMTIDSTVGTFKLDKTYHFSYVKFDTNFLAAYNYNNRENENLFNFNLSNNQIEVNEELDPTTNGLSSSSSIFKLENEIYLVESALYKIVDNELEFIFSIEDIQEVEHQALHIQNDKIVFVQNDPKKIYSYDGSSLIEEADLFQWENVTFFNHIDKFLIADDFVLILDISDEMFRYDKATKEIVHLADHPTSSDFSKILLIHNNRIYFSSNDNLYTTDGYNYNLVLQNFESGLPTVSRNLISFKDLLIAYVDGKFVSIDENDMLTQLSSEFDDPLVLFDWFYLDKSEENLIMGDAYNKIYFDGSDSYQFEMEYGATFNVQGSYENIFFFVENGTEGHVTTFFNGESKVYGKLPDELQQYQVIDYYESNGEGFLLLKFGVNPYDQLYIYKTDENFEQVELVNQYLDVGVFSTSSFSKYQNDGFLYTGDLLFLMNDQNEFIPFQNIKGSSNPTVEEKDGITYFLAVDPLYGRQLFSSPLPSASPSSTNEHNNINVSNLVVSPNPAAEFLNINIKDIFTPPDLNCRYTIYSLNGKLIDTGHTSGLIAIDKLNTGSYLLKVNNKTETRHTIFIKK